MRMYFMNLAERPDGVPVPGYLVQTTSLDGRPINLLIDSGFPESMIGGSHVGWNVTRETFVLEHLRRIRLGSDDIDIVVATHLDPDHGGNHNLFTRATVICQREHHAWASQHLHMRTGGPTARWTQPHIRWQLVDGDIDVAHGVRVIVCSGHVPGHQGVLVTLSTQKFLLAVDAIPRSTQLDGDTRNVSVVDMDEPALRASTRKLVALAGSEGATIIHGHDAAQWRGLRQLPEFYA